MHCHRNFERVNAERGEVMTGIERLARRQKDMADKIRESVVELHRIQDMPAPEQVKLEERRAKSNGARASSRTAQDGALRLRGSGAA